MERVRINEHLSNLINSGRISGKSIRQISKELHISRSTIGRHIQQQRENRAIGTKKMGRSKKTTKKTDRMIALAAKRDRFQTQFKLSRQFNVSITTIRDRLRKKNIRSRVANEEDVSKILKRKRLQWCRQRKRENFRKWIYSDESSFELKNVSVPHRMFVHRTKREKYAECCTIALTTNSRQKLMVWGAISYTGPVAFGFVGGRINARRYIEVLTDNLLPFLDRIPLAQLNETIFQQDNATCHTARATQRFFEQNGIRAVLWPAKSPDLNPIERVWAVLKRAVRNKGPTTIRGLRRTIEEAWNEQVTPKLCASLYDAIPRSITQVIERRGSR